jgi:hypothetical protein
MTLTKEQQVKLLVVLVAAMIAIYGYRSMTAEPPRTQPLVYTPGTKVASPVRSGLKTPGEPQDALSVFLARRVERYPGMQRDLFRVHTAAAAPVVKPHPVAPIEETAPTPTVPQKSPEEIAAETARADLSTFRFLGYLTGEKDSSIFLSKSGELFIAKSGDTVLKNYRVKSVGKDYVILYDTVTKVEVRIELTGGDGKK